MTDGTGYSQGDVPTLSVCMIVRDEERVLERCLLSLPNIDRELVVVDTGSTDGTLDIARKFGARVSSFFGANGPDGRIADFSAARNAVLAQARGDWVLQIDADEVIRSGQDLIANLGTRTEPKVNALAVALHSGDAHWHSVRLFRREAARGYVSAIHEYLDFSGDMVIEPRIVIVNLPDKKGKETGFDRNVRILRKSLQENPRSARLWHYLGNELRSAGQYRNAAQAYGRAQRLGTFTAGLFTSMFYRGVCLFILEELGAAEAQALALISHSPDRAEGYCLLADVQFCQDRFEQARDNYVAARDRPTDPANSMMPVQVWAFDERPNNQITIINSILESGE
ncbi:MAG: glycosyltransferase [Burkholderiaceae bacterium]|nr:glycosyltransferase [Burkholderiaceae bacterium]